MSNLPLFLGLIYYVESEAVIRFIQSSDAYSKIDLDSETTGKTIELIREDDPGSPSVFYNGMVVRPRGEMALNVCLGIFVKPEEENGSKCLSGNIREAGGRKWLSQSLL